MKHIRHDAQEEATNDPEDRDETGANHDRPLHSEPDLEINGATQRLGAGCIAIPFALLAFWMWWIAHNFVRGNGWFDFIARLIVDQLVIGTALIALAFVIWALFAPRWIESLITWATNSAVKAIAIFFLLVIVPALVLALGQFVFWMLGIA